MKKMGLSLLAGVVSLNVQAAKTTELPPLVITPTGQEIPLPEIPVPVNTLDQDTVEEVAPAHPSELMDRLPGVHVNVTGGEGHMTAIRLPITTSPLYLYLEDGIPTRSTGFFNHNALYEIDLPQAGGVEVVNGPGTALYGSDAIGAVINVLSPPPEPQAGTDLEAGPWGWRRALVSAGNTAGADGLDARLNLTHSDGWREATDYDRQSARIRWDKDLAEGRRLRTLLAANRIRQQTAGSSRLSEADYLNDPTRNYTPISYRHVDALRLSTRLDGRWAQGETQVALYARDNRMELLPNWSLSYDPVVYTTANRSLGALLRWHRSGVGPLDRLLLGLDLDYSPGSRVEHAIDPVKEGDVYTDYRVTDLLYDYDVTFTAASPYLHGELEPRPGTRLSLGLRYDHMAYDYQNHLSPLDSGSHRRPPSAQVDFQRATPKIGLTQRLGARHNAFLSWRQGFRVPSESQIFRQGKAENTLDLKPVVADSLDAGLRGELGRLQYSLALYRMILRDDLISYTHEDGTREITNAGRTEHRGIELGAQLPLGHGLALESAWSWSRHTYEAWSPKPGVDYSGKTMERAPSHQGSTRLAWQRAGLRTELEWVSLGAYWMDAANTAEYPGHDLFNLRARWQVNPRLRLYARLMNLTDRRYATLARYSRGERTYAPGTPRALYAGLSYRLP